MEPQLRNILKRVVEAGSASALTAADRDAVRRAIGDDADRTQDGPRPLWHWCAPAHFRFGDLTREYEARFDNRFDGVLIDAGASAGALASTLQRMTPRLQRRRLVRALRRQLGDKDASLREIAAQLVGLAGLTELQHMLEDALESGQEQQRDTGGQVVGAMLESLMMLGSPVARTEGRRLLGSSSRRTRPAAERAVLWGEEPLDDATLERMVKGGFKEQWCMLAPASVVRALERGWIDDAALQTWASGWHPQNTMMSVARAVVAAGHKVGLEQLCTSAREMGVRAAGWAAAFGDHPWALQILRDAMNVANPRAVETQLLATAIASQDFDALRGWLGTDHQVGALLALVAWHGERRDEALRLLDGVSSRGKDEPLLIEMARAVFAEPRDEAEIERRWLRLLILDDPWVTLTLARAFEVYAWPIPEPVQLWLATEEPLEVPTAVRLDALVEMARRDPTVLLQRLRDAKGHSPQWRRAAALVGMAGGEQAVAALGQHLATDDDREGCSLVARAMAAAGLDVTSSVRARLASVDYGREVVLEPGEETEALIAAVSGHDLARVAGNSLNTAADRAAPFLRWQLASQNEDQRGRAVQTAARLSSPLDPHLGDIAALANREVDRLEELSQPELLLASPSADVREMLATLLGRPSHRLSDVAPLLLALMNDEAEGVAWAALGSLASLAPEAPWVTDLILERSRSDHWEAKRRSAAVMATAPHPRFITRLEELAEDENGDYSARESSIMALTRIAEEFPDRGLVVLDVREPNSVLDRYGLTEQIDWNADRHSEAIRLLLVAFDRRKRDDVVKRHVGKKVLFAVPDEINDPNPARLDGATFEALAMNFGVLFADEDSGSIIAEVRDEPSGEIFNALLQTSSIAVARASWS